MTNPRRTLLLIEDNLGDARLLREMINEQGAYNTKLVHVTRMDEAEGYLAANEVDVILLDLGLDDAKGLDAVHRTHAAGPRVPLVVMSGMDYERLGAPALDAGAQDYLVKGQVEAAGLIRALRNAVQRKSLEEALFAEKERAQVTLASIADAVVSTNLEGHITFVNQVAETMTGWALAEVEGRPVGEVIRIIDAKTRVILPPPLDRIALREHADNHRSDCVLLSRDGSEIPVEDSIAVIRDREGKPSGTVIVFRDVAVTRALSQQLAHNAHHDFLTGLPNRVLLHDRISGAISIAPRHNKKVALMFLDLDGFKHINDTMGHEVGDKVLQSVSKRLVAAVRGSDTVSRQGGDEFVVLLSEIGQAEDAAVLARRMLEAVATPHLIEEHELLVSASIGISVFPDDAATAEALVKCADTAMYQAKASGRRTYQFSRPAMNLLASERQVRAALEVSIRDALAGEKFEVHYQPLLNARTKRCAGFEALLRLPDGNGSFIPPTAFIPVAEDIGLITEIGAWVINSATKTAASWPNSLFVSVNLSVRQFHQGDLLGTVERGLAASGLNAKQLELEVTESMLLENTEEIAAQLAALRQLGVSIAMDDFGTGYSSLAYLWQFGFDKLKIDRSFISALDVHGDQARDILETIIVLGHRLQMSVTAEGIETQSQADVLAELDCDHYQGFFYGRPAPAAEIAAFLLDNARARKALTKIPRTRAVA